MTDREDRMTLLKLPSHALAMILCNVARSDAQMGLIEALKARGFGTLLGVLASAPQFLAHVDTPTWLRMVTDAPTYAPVARDVAEMRYKFRVHDLCDLVRLAGRTAHTARAVLQRLRASGEYADGSPQATLLDDGIAGRPRRYPAVPAGAGDDRSFMHQVWDATSELHLRVYARQVPNARQPHPHHATSCSCRACVHGSYGPIEVWDTRKVRDMRSAFLTCSEGQQLDLAFWDTSRVTCMADMFRNMTGKARRVRPGRTARGGSVVTGLRDWNTRSATDMSGMFHNCDWTPDVRNWVTSRVKNMSEMFSHAQADSDGGACNPDVSTWDTSALEIADRMFMGLRLFNCDLSRWDTRRLRDTTQMFQNAGAFDTDLSRWDMRSVTDAEGMFDECPISESRKPRTNRRARLAEKPG